MAITTMCKFSGRTLFTLLLMLTPFTVWGAEYQLEPGNDIIGQIRVVVPTDYKQTYIDLARKYDVAFTELQEANPSVDPWNPAGKNIIIPGRHVLPPGPREGIVINLSELRLYYFKPDGHTVITYPVGIGQMDWPTPIISGRISEKRIHPDWHVPDVIRVSLKARGYNVPEVIAAGPDNPLGDYAMRVGNSDYLIHGTDSPDGVGRRVSHGCVRLYPEDVEALFPEVPQGTPVRIVHEPFKFGWSHGELYLEYHAALKEYHQDPEQVVSSLHAALQEFMHGQKVDINADMLDTLLSRADGMPGVIAHHVEYSAEDSQFTQTNY